MPMMHLKVRAASLSWWHCRQWSPPPPPTVIRCRRRAHFKIVSQFGGPAAHLTRLPGAPTPFPRRRLLFTILLLSVLYSRHLQRAPFHWHWLSVSNYLQQATQCAELGSFKVPEAAHVAARRAGRGVCHPYAHAPIIPAALWQSEAPPHTGIVHCTYAAHVAPREPGSCRCGWRLRRSLSPARRRIRREG